MLGGGGAVSVSSAEFPGVVVDEIGKAGGGAGSGHPAGAVFVEGEEEVGSFFEGFGDVGATGDFDFGVEVVEEASGEAVHEVEPFFVGVEETDFEGGVGVPGGEGREDRGSAAAAPGSDESDDPFGHQGSILPVGLGMVMFEGFGRGFG